MVGVAKATNQAKSEGATNGNNISSNYTTYVDQLISGTNNSDTINTVATTGTTNMTIDGDRPVTTVVTDINQSLTPQ